MLIMVVFWKYTMRFIDLPLLTLSVAFIAFPIFHISPRHISFLYDGKKVILEDRPKIIFIDILFHWTPLLFVLLNKSIAKRPIDYTKVLFTLIFVLFYINAFNAFELYNFKHKELGILFFVLAVVVRFILV